MVKCIGGARKKVTAGFSIRKSDASVLPDEELIFDLFERDSRPESLRVDLNWHDLKTGAETHLGYALVDTHDLA